MADNNLLNNINPNFFEGVEKLLEIWFAPAANADLRKIPRYIFLIKNHSRHNRHKNIDFQPWK
jgi:hypothetical protein